METSPSLDGAVERRAAEGWLARLAPLLAGPASEANEARRRLDELARFAAEGPEVESRVALYGGTQGGELARTLARMHGQIGELEEQERRAIARLEPGAADGSPNLAAIAERLDELEARREIGLPAGEAPAVWRTGDGSTLGAAGLVVFGGGWLSFTGVHAALMVSAVWKTFSYAALALIPFYGVFFAVGFSIFYGAWQILGQESVELAGRTLSVIVRRGRFVRARRWSLSEAAEVEVLEYASKDSTTRGEIVGRDASGERFAFGSRLAPRERHRVANEINARLSPSRHGG